ncbi:MAG: ribulose-phosphate 3-epimerase [Ignavibacteria bacterium]|nr:ribulose-phosphate 3-epimerase [Ignavibacteria bacterium]
MKPLFAPSILSADFAALRDEIRLVESAGADILHLDVMDGHFVPNITFGPKFVKDINRITELPLDVHLMISEPEKYIEKFAEAGADWISVHYEATDHLHKLVSQIKNCNCKAGVVINPATSVDLLDEILPYTDFVLIMSVNPGFGGQEFIPTSLDKARRLSEMIRKSNLNTFIEMDGGIGPENISKIRNSGVSVFVAGNSVFCADDPAEAVKKMKSLITA